MMEHPLLSLISSLLLLALVVLSTPPSINNNSWDGGRTSGIIVVVSALPDVSSKSTSNSYSGRGHHRQSNHHHHHRRRSLNDKNSGTTTTTALTSRKDTKNSKNNNKKKIKKDSIIGDKNSGTGNTSSTSSPRSPSPKHQSPTEEEDRDDDDNDNDNNNDSNNDNDNNDLAVTIESFLIPRKLSLRFVLRTAGFVSIMFWFRQCLVTRGVPFVVSIWTILNSSNNNNNRKTPLHDYRPTHADIQLATLLAPFSKGNEMIPPMNLPSAYAIMGLVVSVFLFVFLNVLLPQWSTIFNVWLDYNQFQSIVCHDGHDDDKKKKKLMNGKKKNKKTKTKQNKKKNLSSTQLLSTTLSSSSSSSSVKVLVRSLVDAGRRGKNGGDQYRRRNAMGRATDRTTMGSPSTTNALTIHPLHQINTLSSKRIATTGKNTDVESINDERRKNDDDGIEGNGMDSVGKSFVHPKEFYFDFDQHRVYCDVTTKRCLDGSPTLHRSNLASLQRIASIDDRPLCGDEKRCRISVERYGPYNAFHVATPTMKEALVARLSSPLVVVQMVGFLMSSLEAGYQALLDAVLCVGGHYRNAWQAIASGRQMAKEVKSNLQDTSDYQVTKLVEPGRWENTTASDLVPGDIFRIVHDHGSTVIPVDALLLQGQCLINEAVLTGESVPQIKHPINFDEETTGDPSSRLDMEGRHRMSVLFAGTDLIHIPSLLGAGTGDHSLTCMALRTGTYSSKGKLLKSLRNNNHVGEISNPQSQSDAMRIVGAMSVCGVLSCLSIFVRGDDERVAKVSPFRRVVQCTRILMASIPSGLPYALSAVARSCSTKLRGDCDVACSEPGSLLTAAEVDTIVFDKTGTLTADTQSVANLIPASCDSLETHQTQSFMKCILAGCHSIVHFSEEGKTENNATSFGDPLDLASLRYSGWLYDAATSSYLEPTVNSTTEGRRIYVIRDFPFDPNRRLSSSIVLLQLKPGEFQLWQFTKGSPETIESLCSNNADVKNQAEDLETQGYRTIALSARDISSSEVSKLLFPAGMSSKPGEISGARSKGTQLRRTDFEDVNTFSEIDNNLEFIGFSCFDASVRPSSKRVVRELTIGGIDCKMLTGDSLNAALSVARKVHLINNRNIAILDVDEMTSCEGEEPMLVFRLIKSRVESDGSLTDLTDQSHELPVTTNSIKKVLRLQAAGKCSLVSNGKALECLLDREKDFEAIFSATLSSLNIVARATPDLKRRYIDGLQKYSEKTVMMCGDGVNDVSAIQTADVAAALLTGFGHEDQLGLDVDDARRMRTLDETNIGGNRSKNKGTTKAKQQEAKQRIQKKIDLARKKIDERALERKKEAGDDDDVPLSRHYTFGDTKELLSAIMEAQRSENRRQKLLRSGASEAARILAEERKKESYGDDDDSSDGASFESDQKSIKPGEVSLVAPFSCLHPSIDGVESILRQGIAAAACVIGTQQNIVLHSLMSCFHLATLYRDGFRYGTIMWPVESTLYSILDMACFRASCSPRPRLPTSEYIRPQKSLFDRSSLFLILSQATMNVLSISIGVNFAKELQKTLLSPDNKAEALHRRGVSVLTANGGKLGQVMNAISRSIVLQSDDNESSEDSAEGSGAIAGSSIVSSILRRPPFVPNFETNVVFLLSTLQSAVVSLLNHRGKPFQQSAFENRPLCWNFCATVLFYFVSVAGTVPVLTKQLEIKPFPTRRSKMVMLAIGLMNVVGCFACRILADKMYWRDVNRHTVSQSQSPATRRKKRRRKNTNHSSSKHSSAADHEEQLLDEESKLNVTGIKSFTVLMFVLTWDLVTRG